MTTESVISKSIDDCCLKFDAFNMWSFALSFQSLTFLKKLKLIKVWKSFLTKSSFEFNSCKARLKNHEAKLLKLKNILSKPELFWV